MSSIEAILKRLRESRVNEAGVYSPYDHSDRDNSVEVDAMKSEEASHPYVGKVVRWKEDGKSHTVTAAFDASDGIHVRCDNITMKPDEYRIIKEEVEEGPGPHYPEYVPAAFYPLYDKLGDKIWYNKYQLMDDVESLGYEVLPYADTSISISPDEDSDYYLIISIVMEHPHRYTLDFEYSREIGEYIPREDESYTVIDNTDTKNSGDSEKYKVNTKEEAEQRKQELIDQGSDEDKITIK